MLPQPSALSTALEYLEMSNWTQLNWAWVSACYCLKQERERERECRAVVRVGGCGFRVWSGFDFLTCCLPACLTGCRLLYQHRRRQLWKSTQAILLLACAPKMVYFPPLLTHPLRRYPSGLLYPLCLGCLRESN